MAAEELFSTLHNFSDTETMRIDRIKYDTVREVIMRILRMYGSMTYSELAELVEIQLQNNFDGSITWYFSNVMMDLETSRDIRRRSISKPQLIEIVE